MYHILDSTYQLCDSVGCSMQGFPILLLTQMVKNLPEIQETWVQSLGWEYPLEKEMETHFSILAKRIL